MTSGDCERECESNQLPCFVQLALHWQPGKVRAHNITINHGDEFGCLERLVPKSVEVYLVARRQFYTAQSEASESPLRGIPAPNAFIHWGDDRANVLEELLDEEIEPMARIRVPAWNPCAFAIYNADIRSGRDGVKVNVFVAVQNMMEYRGKLFSETL